MRSAFALSAIAICAVAILIASNSNAQNSMIYGVPTITDGDTIAINGQGIRLNGFDTPERGHRCNGAVNPWSLAKHELDRFIDRRPVSCEIVGYDTRNNRPVARCVVGGEELGDHMVRQGLARDWPMYSCGAYAEREAAARQESRGLWAMSCPGLWGDRDYVTPCRRP